MSKLASYAYRPFQTILALLAVPTILTSCDTTFEPLQENDQYHFSVYGYLDVSADTQWVRVTPVRDQLRPTGEPLDATVTLENLSNGETIVMNDSLIQILGETVPVVWTTEKIEPDTPYELHIQGKQQQESLASTHTPEEIPTPLVDLSPGSSSRPHAVFVEVPGTLVDVRAIYCLREHGDSEEEFVIFSIPIGEHRFRTSEGYPNRYRVEFRGIANYLLDRVLLTPPESLSDRYEYFPRQAKVYTSNDSWPDFASLDQFEQELPEGVTSNVVGGVGFLGGLLSKTVPFKTCQNGAGERIACETEPFITSPLDCLYDGEFDPLN